jgi:tetratricopeptide (TPR) repeat protein
VQITGAQNAFLIYSFKGNVTIIEKAVSTKAKIGRMLPEDAQVVVAPGSVLTLICNQASLITLNKGKVSLSDLADQCEAGKQSVSSNYLRYVWTQLTNKPGTPEKNRKLFMTNVGAVSRGINNIWIDPRLDTLKFINGSFPLSWKSFAEAENFDFSVYDKAEDGEVIYRTTLKKRSIDAKQFITKLERGNIYYWTAAIMGEQNRERKALYYAKPGEYESLLKAFEEAGPEMELPAAKAFRLGFMLEQAHYLGEAYSYYKKAATIDPSASIYKSTLESFKKDYEL